MNLQPGNKANPANRMNITVTNRRQYGIIGTIVEVVGGVAVLAVIIVVLLTGLGATMVNMKTSGGLPQPVIDYSTGFYHYFFG